MESPSHSNQGVVPIVLFSLCQPFRVTAYRTGANPLIHRSHSVYPSEKPWFPLAAWSNVCVYEALRPHAALTVLVDLWRASRNVGKTNL